MAEDLTIKTGVDRLIDLVDQKKEIKLADAAKMLSVPVGVIEEWSDFLEEKGVLTVKYKFTVPYLVKKPGTKDEIQKEIKAVTGQKGAVLKKADELVTSISKDTDMFTKFKSDFDSLVGDIGKSATSVQSHINALDSVKKLQAELVENQKGSEQKIGSIYNKLKFDVDAAKKSLVEEVNKIEAQKAQIKLDLDKAIKVQESQDALNAKLESVLNEQKKLAKDLADGMNKANTSALKFKDLIHRLSLAQTTYETRLKSMDPFFKQVELEKKKLEDLSLKVAKQVESLGVSAISAPTGRGNIAISAKMLDKKKDLEEAMDQTSSDFRGLLLEVKELITMLRVLKSLQSEDQIEKAVNALDTKLSDLESKRDKFHKSVAKIMGSFHG